MVILDHDDFRSPARTRDEAIEIAQRSADREKAPVFVRELRRGCWSVSLDSCGYYNSTEFVVGPRTVSSGEGSFVRGEKRTMRTATKITIEAMTPTGEAGQ